MLPASGCAVLKVFWSEKMMNNMTIQILPFDMTVCKVGSVSQLDPADDFCFIGITDEEISLVCRTENTPEQTVEREDGWRGFRIGGVLDFSLIGFLSELSGVLAQNGIGIFAVSTYNTDYILVKARDLDKAVQALAEAGCTVCQPE